VGAVTKRCAKLTVAGLILAGIMVSSPKKGLLKQQQQQQQQQKSAF